ncbi:MAG TPA: ATP-binding protein [Roseiflexaceae bacterium]|nr:ATP-binding protein [Roseiflexaceae bacterium]
MTLRSRLTIAYVGFFAIALVALDIGLYLIVRQALFSSIDSDLERGAQYLQDGFTNSNERLRASNDQRVRDYFSENSVFVLTPQTVSGFDATNLKVQVYQPDGALVGKSPNVQYTISVNENLLDQALAGQETIHTVDNGKMRSRELLQPLLFRGQVVGALQVTRSLRETDFALQLLLYVLLGGGAIVLLTAARGGAWLTRAAFKPIDEVTRTAQSIVRAEDLSRRVPVPPAQDELQRLTVTVNDLLARLEVLFSAQRRFVADVSHELRTPLAAMQGNLEVLDRGAARDPELLAESLSDMRREVARLIRMANDLLLLAQSEAGVQLRDEPIELDTLLLEVHRELRPLASGVQLRLGHEDQIVVQGDRDRIKQALLNLGVNALQHTPAGGTVTLGLARQDGYAALTVIDSGHGIASDDLPHIFDRFYRADRSRSHHHGGAGLGLAIVKWVAEAHSGRVDVVSTPGAGSQFSLLLPLQLGDATELQFIHHVAAPS